MRSARQSDERQHDNPGCDHLRFHLWPREWGKAMRTIDRLDIAQWRARWARENAQEAIPECRLTETAALREAAQAPLKGRGEAMPRGGLFDLEARKQGEMF